MTDLTHLRADFPILDREVHGRRLVFLDSGASAQKPRQVLEAMDSFQRTSYANVHRGAYLLSEEATNAYEDARDKVAAFLNAGSSREVVFTRGTTTGMNTVAFGWGLNHLEPGDRVVITTMEHHANIVPWHLLSRYREFDLRYIPLTAEYRLDLDAYERELADTTRGPVKIVSMTGMSNVLGTVTPIPDIAARAHDAGALMVVDAAQQATHLPVDVSTLGADLVAFGAHKLLGPTGIGALWGKPDVLETMEPFEGGGEMINDVGLDASTWAPVPHKFEAGTPPITEAVGFGAAVDYLAKVGMTAVRDHDTMLTEYALGRLREMSGVTVFGPDTSEARGGVVSFAVDGIHAHDIATILDGDGVAVRAGHHCTKPLHRHLGVPATARASFHVYNTTDDVDALTDAIEHAQRVFA